jgi:hypothetical protein
MATIFDTQRLRKIQWRVTPQSDSPHTTKKGGHGEWPRFPPKEQSHGRDCSLVGDAPTTNKGVDQKFLRRHTTWSRAGASLTLLVCPGTSGPLHGRAQKFGGAGGTSRVDHVSLVHPRWTTCILSSGHRTLWIESSSVQQAVGVGDLSEA